MSIYAIGDVQGCLASLKDLLNKINFNSKQDKLWFAGDIVNRGPHSLDTLRFIRSLGEQAITVLGNHDLHLLAIANGCGKQSKKDTLGDILKADDKNELLNWLLHRPLMHYDQSLNVYLCHAGIYPKWSVSEALQYANEVETVLQGKNSRDFFHHMYGDKPSAWSEKLSSWDRLRFITNAFTRMRYCDQHGHLSLREKCAPGKQARNLYPWFEVETRKARGSNIVFGHWSTLKNTNQNHLYPLDTGCLWGGKLTALKIDEQLTERIEVPCPEPQSLFTNP